MKIERIVGSYSGWNRLGVVCAYTRKRSIGGKSEIHFTRNGIEIFQAIDLR